VDFCPFRGPDTPHALTESIPGKKTHTQVVDTELKNASSTTLHFDRDNNFLWGAGILWHAIWVAFILAEIAEAYFLQSPAFQHLCQIVIVAGIAAFDCILFPVCIREIFRPGGNRGIAAAQSLMEVIILLGVLGYSVHLKLGPFPLDLFQLTLTLLDLAVAAMLFRRAWKAWKESSALRAEFEAAQRNPQRAVNISRRKQWIELQQSS
jgi:hypothetical protein